MRRSNGCFLIVAVVLGLGCAATLPPCPAHGGPVWREYSTAHFDLRSDLDPEEAKNVARALEDTRAAMLAIFWKGADEPSDRTQVVALASDSAREIFLGSARGAYSRSPPLLPSIMFSGADLMVTSVLRHELAHDLGRWFLPIQPDWLSEGIAALLETARYDRDRKRAYGGDIPQHWLRTVRAWGVLDLERLFATETTRDHADNLARFEASSWLLVHYLVNHRRESFLAFQRRLSLLQPSRQAWQAEFSDLDLAKLTDILTGYARNGRFAVVEVPLELEEWQVASRPLSDPEVHAVRGYLFAMFYGPGRNPDLKAAAAEIAEALSAQRPPLTAFAVAFYRLQGRNDSRARVALAQQAVAIHPDSWLAWLMVADATDFKDAAYGSALVRALARAPNNREVLERMAALTANERRWKDALAFSRKAINANSRTPDLFLVHVRALAQSGDCAEAARWIVALLAAVSSERRTEIANTWKDLQRTCSTPATAPAGTGG